ncbi:MAG: RluA family pseudouridine synthase [Spirochaetaceae bacterium]|nr:RluA family pseudouridine synthase [Spirochaetaceae bacterium]
MKEIPIIYENNEILIVNKRAGLAVQGGEGVKNPLDSLLCEQLGAKVYPVHRLDKETSGLLVVAKTSAAAHLWTGLIASGQVKKEYQALCFGLVQGLKSSTALGKTGRLTQKVQVAGAGKTAETFYQVTGIFPVAEITPLAEQMADLGTNPLFSLLNLTLGTGRTHQIRIHLAQAGCPILADDKHGNFKVNKLVKKAVGIKTLQLAATRLTIPLEGRATTFQIPLPPHMEEALSVLSNAFPRES